MTGARAITLLVDPRNDCSALVDFVRNTLGSGPNRPKLRVVCVYEEIPWYARLVLQDGDKLNANMVEWLGGKLSQVAESIRTAGLDVSTEVLTGKTAVAVSRDLAKTAAELLITPLPPQRDDRTTARDLQLLRFAPCPILLLRGSPGADFPRRVLAAVAPHAQEPGEEILHFDVLSDDARTNIDLRVLTVARSCAERSGGELHVVHAWHVPGEDLLANHHLVDTDQVAGYVEATRAAHAEALDALLASSGPDIRKERAHLVKGAAAVAISDAVRTHGIDLLVLGTVARTGVPGFLLGSTAESIARDAPCSILVVKPEGFVSPVVTS